MVGQLVITVASVDEAAARLQTFRHRPYFYPLLWPLAG